MVGSRHGRHDDWVGEPPDGRYTRDRAKPQHWSNQWQAALAGSILFFLLLKRSR